jgi:hypothetical protein
MIRTTEIRLEIAIRQEHIGLSPDVHIGLGIHGPQTR